MAVQERLVFNHTLPAERKLSLDILDGEPAIRDIATNVVRSRPPHSHLLYAACAPHVRTTRKAIAAHLARATACDCCVIAVVDHGRRR